MFTDVEPTPPILYKYRSLSDKFGKRFLFNQEIYWTPPAIFNDPFDCGIPWQYHTIDLCPGGKMYKSIENLKREQEPHLTENEIQKYLSLELVNGILPINDRLQEVSSIMNEYDQNNYGVISFTTDPKNFLMWSHYADKHNGYCIGLKSQELESLFQLPVFPVTYSEYLPHVNTKIDFNNDHDMVKFIKQRYCTKGKFWKYENEFRFVAPNFAKKTSNFNFDFISEIFLGLNMSPYRKKKIRSFVKKNNLRNCKVFEMKLSKSRFALESVEVV